MLIFEHGIMHCMASKHVSNKKQRGQFFTAEADYILQGFEKFIVGKKVSDPFAGSGDLLRWAKENGARSVKGFEIDSQLADSKHIFLNDSLLNPKTYDFVVTNPPYLNVNKADKNTKEKYFRKHQFEDLYQLSLAAIMDSEEGIVIVPINFLSAFNARGIRNLFFSKFEMDRMNYFRHQVFPDTTYNVIAFHYVRKRPGARGNFSIKTHIFPEGERVSVELKQIFNWTIGGDIYEKLKDQKNILGIHRLVEDHIHDHRGRTPLRGSYNHVKVPHVAYVSEEFARRVQSNIMLVRAIDGGSESSRMGIDDIRQYGIKCLVSKPTSRHMIQLIAEQAIPLDEQKILIDRFNQELSELRKRHLSLFLTNYRDKDRKRISFDFVYKLLNYLYVRDIAPQSRYESMGTKKLNFGQ